MNPITYSYLVVDGDHLYLHNERRHSIERMSVFGGPITVIVSGGDDGFAITDVSTCAVKGQNSLMVVIWYFVVVHMDSCVSTFWLPNNFKL